MIFHTASDPVYYHAFYKYYLRSIKQFYSKSKMSLYFIGQELPINSSIDILEHDNFSFEKIQQTYNSTIENAKGYYALSRWRSMPVLDDHVVVSDIDIIAIKHLPLSKIDDLLINHEVINITRTKKGGSEGGMAMMIIRKDVVESINQKATEVLDNKLQWDSDVQVRSFIYNNYNVAQLPEMHVFGKKTNYQTFDNTTRSFAIHKGRIDTKIASLKKAVDYL